MSVCQNYPHPYWGAGPCMYPESEMIRRIWRESLYGAPYCSDAITAPSHRLCVSARYATRRHLSWKAARRHQRTSHPGSIMIGPTATAYGGQEWHLCWFVCGGEAPRGAYLHL